MQSSTHVWWMRWNEQQGMTFSARIRYPTATQIPNINLINMPRLSSPSSTTSSELHFHYICSTAQLSAYLLYFFWLRITLVFRHSVCNNKLQIISSFQLYATAAILSLRHVYVWCVQVYVHVFVCICPRELCPQQYCFPWLLTNSQKNGCYLAVQHGPHSLW
jgi:hypothetical protein